eukprot:gene3046-816_t
MLKIVPTLPALPGKPGWLRRLARMPSKLAGCPGAWLQLLKLSFAYRSAAARLRARPEK